MSIALSEKNLKEKWLRSYQEEIYMNKEKREVEVNKTFKLSILYFLSKLKINRNLKF